jgi:hypothetical protein
LIFDGKFLIAEVMMKIYARARRTRFYGQIIASKISMLDMLHLACSLYLMSPRRTMRLVSGLIISMICWVLPGHAQDVDAALPVSPAVSAEQSRQNIEPVSFNKRHEDPAKVLAIIEGLLEKNNTAYSNKAKLPPPAGTK